MKKIMFTFIAAASMATLGMEKLDLRDPASKYKAAFAKAMAEKDNGKCLKLLEDCGFWQCYAYGAAEDYKDEDAALLSRGLPPPMYCNRILPESWGKLTLPKLRHIQVAIDTADRLGCALTLYQMVQSASSYGDLICIVKSWATEGYGSFEGYDIVMKRMQDLGVRSVRKHLRRQGKSFVTKDGVNPCEAYLSRLAGALNSPRLEGLSAWLKEVGIDEPIDLSWIPSTDKINALRDSILDADKDLSERDKRMLRLGLGSDGYNNFVKEYNGEK